MLMIREKKTTIHIKIVKWNIQRRKCGYKILIPKKSDYNHFEDRADDCGPF